MTTPTPTHIPLSVSESAFLRAALEPQPYPASLLAARREAILNHYRNLTPEQQANVCEELALIQITEDKE